MYKAKHFDGQSAISRAVQLFIENKQLIVRDTRTQEQIDSWEISDLRLDPLSPSHPMIMSIHEPDGRVEVIDEKIISVLQSINSNFKTTKNRKKWLLIFTSAFALLALIGYFHLSKLSRFLSQQIPFELEKEIGKKLDPTRHFETCKLDEETNLALQKLLVKLHPIFPEDSYFSIHVQLTRDPTVNAYTFLGGEIFINKGLLEETESAEELAGVVAHEIGHAQYRHITRNLIQSSLLGTLLNFISGNSSSLLLTDPGSTAQLISLKFSRDLENEADKAAVTRLERSGIGDQGYLSFFKRDKNKIEKALSFISTHPSSDTRAALIEKNLEPSTQNIYPLTPLEFQLLKMACP